MKFIPTTPKIFSCHGSKSVHRVHVFIKKKIIIPSHNNMSDEKPPSHPNTSFPNQAPTPNPTLNNSTATNITNLSSTSVFMNPNNSSNHVSSIHPSLLEVMDPVNDNSYYADERVLDEEEGFLMSDDDHDDGSNSDEDEDDFNDDLIPKPDFYYTSPSINKFKLAQNPPPLPAPESSHPTTDSSMGGQRIPIPPIPINRRSSLETIDTPPNSLSDNNNVDNNVDNVDDNNNNNNDAKTNVLILDPNCLTSPLLPALNPTKRNRTRNRSRSRSRSRMSCLCPCPNFSISLRAQFRYSSIYTIFFCVVNVCLSTYYAWISSNEFAYAPEDWQQCILYGVAPLSAGLPSNTHFALSASAR